MKFKLLLILALAFMGSSAFAQTTDPGAIYKSPDYIKVLEKTNFNGTRQIIVPKQMSTSNVQIQQLNVTNTQITNESIQNLEKSIRGGDSTGLGNLTVSFGESFKNPEAFMASLMGLAAIGGDGSGFFALLSGLHKPFTECLEKVGTEGSSYATQNPALCYSQHIYPLLSNMQSMNFENITTKLESSSKRIAE